MLERHSAWGSGLVSRSQAEGERGQVGLSDCGKESAAQSPLAATRREQQVSGARPGRSGGSEAVLWLWVLHLFC